MVSAEHLRRVTDYIDLGRREGGTIASRPPDLPDVDYLVGPTVFTDVTPGTGIAREQIFGPVLTVLTFDDEDEACSLADATDYGLGVGIHTRGIRSRAAGGRRLRHGQQLLRPWDRARLSAAGNSAVRAGGADSSRWTATSRSPTARPGSDEENGW